MKPAGITWTTHQPHWATVWMLSAWIGSVGGRLWWSITIVSAIIGCLSLAREIANNSRQGDDCATRSPRTLEVDARNSWAAAVTSETHLTKQPQVTEETGNEGRDPRPNTSPKESHDGRDLI